MATGKPILYIGEADSEIASVINRYGIGWVVDPNNPDKLKERINDIIQVKDSISERGAKALEVAQTVFAKEIVLEQYYQFVSKNI